MQREVLLGLSWELDEEGGGEARAEVETPGGGSRTLRYVFESLEDSDHLPRIIAEIIEEDGRDDGEWTPE